MYLGSGITAPWILMEVGATSSCQIYGCLDFKISSIDREDKQTRKIKSQEFIVSPDESRGYLGFSTVTPPPPERFPFGRDNLKNILVRTFNFGMWVYMGNATNAIVL